MNKLLYASIAVVIIAVLLADFLFLRLNSSEIMYFDKMHTEEIMLDGFAMTVKIADVQPEWNAGFQNVSLDVIEKTAILFVFPSAENRTFHMRNVAAELDIAFADSDGVIFQVQRMGPGDSLYASSAPAMYALETRAGYIEENNITVRTRIVFRQ
ncbi:MAG TPA: DUF192 domain-containing protein [Candidatus Nanoarchaeia archaeon]|nr:DUF192 domain-containing protein [Candidatus Nanoarchaeia archaeon]